MNSLNNNLSVSENINIPSRGWTKIGHQWVLNSQVQSKCIQRDKKNEQKQREYVMNQQQKKAEYAVTKGVRVLIPNELRQEFEKFSQYNHLYCGKIYQSTNQIPDGYTEYGIYLDNPLTNIFVMTNIYRKFGAPDKAKELLLSSGLRLTVPFANLAIFKDIAKKYWLFTLWDPTKKEWIINHNQRCYGRGHNFDNIHQELILKAGATIHYIIEGAGGDHA